jgi:hypothetical protein
MGESTLNESGVVSMFGPLSRRQTFRIARKTAVLLVYELQVAIGLEAHLQKKNWGIMES